MTMVERTSLIHDFMSAHDPIVLQKSAACAQYATIESKRPAT